MDTDDINLHGKLMIMMDKLQELFLMASSAAIKTQIVITTQHALQKITWTTGQSRSDLNIF